MPYASKKQERFFHTDTAKKAGITPAEVKEYDKASKGLKLSEAAHTPGKARRKRLRRMGQ